MSNTWTISLVLAAAALSIILAAHTQSGPSLLSERHARVPGIAAWDKAIAQNGDPATKTR